MLSLSAGGVSSAEPLAGCPWTTVASPNVAAVQDLNDVSVLSPTDVWATGFQAKNLSSASALALHWNGHGWRSIATAPVGTSHQLGGGLLALSVADVWAGGGVIDLAGQAHPLAEHWDGLAWTVV